MSIAKNRSLGNAIEAASPSLPVSYRGIDFTDSNVTTGSFRHDTPGAPLRSTQQLPIDWSDFSRHTFFGSAEVAVNVAFDKIINGFPFDGNSQEIGNFLDGLSGFERYVYDSFQKSLNCIFITASHIAVNDVAGGTDTALSKRKDGSNVLDPGLQSFSLQLKLFVPSDSNTDSVIVQRASGTSGYTLALEANATSDTGVVMFMVTSGSAEIRTSASFEKGKWFDLCAQTVRRPSINKLAVSIDGVLRSTSSTAYELEEFSTRGTLLLIGSGTSHVGTATIFTPTSNLSASIDDLKFFIGNRSQEDILQVSKRGVWPRDDLKLLFRFNEPAGDYAQKDLLLDSSGNGLHSRVTNYSDAVRSSPDGLPFFYERPEYNPTLFPDAEEIVNLNSSLLLSASQYDEKNPNLITRLIPPHYLQEGQVSQGLETEEGKIVEAYPESGDTPRQAKLGSAQIISSMLYIWAKQFDEYKLFLDQFSLLDDINPVSTGSVANTFILRQSKEFGFELPKLFEQNDLKSSEFGDDIGIDPSAGNVPLSELQYQAWRRIVSNFPDVISSKGTLYSVKSLIRSFGVNPDTAVRVREYGGSRSGYIGGRVPRRDSIGELVVTGSWRATSPFLSGTRVEPGLPSPKGTFINGVSDSPDDGLLTSGSWSWEGSFTYPLTRQKNGYESLVRMYCTGSSGLGMLANLTFDTNGIVASKVANVRLHAAYSTVIPNGFELLIPTASVLDGDRWSVSFGREKLSPQMSRWFLRAGKEIAGEVAESYSTETYVTCSEQDDAFSNKGSVFNASGSFFVLGNEPNIVTAGQFVEYAYPSFVTGAFLGNVSRVRFYSKFNDDAEWLEHIRDVTSTGVKDPLTNFNFVTTASGSYERLRLDVPFDQDITGSDTSGEIQFFDYSQNSLHLTGVNFPVSTTVLGNTDVLYSGLDPKFDERSTNNKVRVRSWQSYENAVKYGGEVGHAYEVPRNEEGADDTRFGIEISVVQGLNEDIMRMFADHSAIDDAVGEPNAIFDDSYAHLDDIREVYFNRLTGPTDFHNVFLFSKWFEGTIGKLVEQIIPANTRYFGTNFVIESHVLERNRMRYTWGDLYLGENDRLGLRGTIGLSQLLATMRRS